MKRLFFGCWLALIVVSGARACMWDRDTVANESKGVPNAIDVIAGRFERNPPLYFQMRKERVLALLRREPANLAAYDDAAVASDRLGDDDGAIKLMEAKARQLPMTNMPEKNEQLYRYEANLGTFYAHRWIRSGANRKKMGDMDLASQHIGEALRINPNAHFGREKYQLLLIDWIRKPPLPETYRRHFPTFLTPPFKEVKAHEFSDADRWSIALSGLGGAKILEEFGFGNAVEGLSGLVSLGNAWESVDVYCALGVVLEVERRATIAYLARLRIEELIDHGGCSLFPDAPSGKDLKRRFEFLGSRIGTGRNLALRIQYSLLRASAERWQANRTAYMEGRLKKGSHPDTDPDFWSGYREIPRPSLHPWYRFIDILMSLESMIVSPLILLLVVMIWRRRSKAAATRLAV